MTQENVEIVQAAFRAFESDDMDGVLRLCDENIEITQDADLLGAPAHQHGHAGVLEAFALWPDLWEDFRVEVLRLDDFGDHVMVATVNRGRGRGSGVPVEMPFTFLFSIRAGKIAEWRLFMSEEQALKTVGLEE
jgi:ketosteroid isomerase-like protein